MKNSYNRQNCELGISFRTPSNFVKENGDSVVQNRGILKDREIKKIQSFIKDNYKEMNLKWMEYSKEGFYNED